MYEVLSPRGEATLGAVGAAPRLSDLSGKTVCEIWNGSFKGHITFPIIRELLRKRYPGIKVIPYDEFPVQHHHASTGQLLERLDAAVALAIQKGCDAVITGNGF
ncbi:MAG: hypothetical protein HYX92_05930 [Chloroflexi bacterium]|nr:hypothetical protein [Chloroflexota bacterium]